MIKSKLVELLKQFDRKDWRAFSNYLHSPYFNKSEEVISLMELLKLKAEKSFPASEMKRATVFKEIFPNQPYNDKNLNHLMSQLFKHAERFLSIEAFEQDGILPDYYLLNTYVDRKLDKPYQLAFRRAQKKLNDSPYRDENYYFQEYLLEDIADKHFQAKELRQYDEHLERASAAFDRFYYTQKLKYLVAKLGWEKIISKPFERPMMEEVKSIIKNYDLLEVPQIKVYFQLLLMLTKQDSEPYYEELKDNLALYSKFFPKKELTNLYSFISNYCAEKIRKGDKKYTQELMDVYIKGLEDGFFLDDGMVSPWLFKNMVKLGIGLKNYSWTADFIANYSERLPEEKRKDAYYFNMADMFYAQKKYDEAIFYLNQVEFSDVHYSLGAKELLLRLYYTIGETEAFLSLVFSFRIYLKRNKLITSETKTAYDNFIRFVHQLHKNDAKKIEIIEEKINKTKLLIARNWLQQQVNLKRI
ncbi:MAG: hypothetical protein DWQ02_03320 [Bacteroidetes bacterium]|nr:MAG: hypothetical protein DWQ02_03320 [Bacteroidota bacterium]